MKSFLTQPITSCNHVNMATITQYLLILCQGWNVVLSWIEKHADDGDLEGIASCNSWTHKWTCPDEDVFWDS